MSANHTYDEKALLLKIAAGDQLAFNRLADRYASVIYGHLLSYLKDVQLSEEITQDILLGLWKHRTTLPQIANLPGYIFTMTRNRAYSGFRDKLYASTTPPPDILESALMTPATATEYRQLYHILMEGIGQLPARRKEVFSLSRLENKSYEEIATQLGISRSAVRQHIIEALVFLRTYLKQRSDIIISFLLFFLIPT